jgi:hypothetical protein
MGMRRRRSRWLGFRQIGREGGDDFEVHEMMRYQFDLWFC